MNPAFSSLGYLRLGVASPAVQVADVDFNRIEIMRTLKRLHDDHVQLAVFPELCITGYTCGDLFYQTLLLEKAQQALMVLARETGQLGMAAVVGLPLRVDGALYNCAAFLAEGRVLGLVPKTFLPNTNEFYEERWFASALECSRDTLWMAGDQVPFVPLFHLNQKLLVL